MDFTIYNWFVVYFLSICLFFPTRRSKLIWNQITVEDQATTSVQGLNLTCSTLVLWVSGRCFCLRITFPPFLMWDIKAHLFTKTHTPSYTHLCIPSCLHEDGYQWQPLFSLVLFSLSSLWLHNHIQLGSPGSPLTNTQKAEPCLNPAALINLTDFVNYLFGWLTASLSPSHSLYVCMCMCMCVTVPPSPVTWMIKTLK